MGKPSGGVSPASLSLAGLQIDPDALARLPKAERQLVADQLREVEEAFKRNPLLAYQPHEKQARFHRLPSARSRLFIGGNRSGKTTSTHVDTIIQCIDVDVVPEHLLAYKLWEPPFYCRIVGPDLTRWLEGVSLQKFREWCPRGQLRGGSLERGWDKQQLMLRFKNGSWVQFMSNDQDLDKFAGAALKRVVYDEPPRQDIRRECLMRLIDYGGEELYGLTPTEGMSNWLYDDFYEPWEKLREQDLSDGEVEAALGARLLLVDMDDNPHLARADKEWALGGLSREEREGRRTGRFVAFSGLIYHEFSKSRHVIPAEGRLPEGVEVFAGIDAGLRQPAVVYAYLDQDDTMVVFDEIAPRNWTIPRVCAEIQRRNAKWGITPRWYVIDPAVRNKNSQTGRSDQQEFVDNGIVAIPGQNDVRTGINKVKVRLEADPPKLLVAAGCETLLGEFKKYRWKTPAARTENQAREAPVKADDHCLDALRYVCMQRPWAPNPDAPKPSDTMKDRILRHHLKRLKRPAMADSGFGPGQFT
jgi:hypothetical protein